jgi:hypothetical protein
MENNEHTFMNMNQSQPKNTHSTFKSKAISILRIQTAFTSKRDNERTYESPMLSITQRNENEIRQGFPSSAGKETNFRRTFLANDFKEKSSPKTEDPKVSNLASKGNSGFNINAINAIASPDLHIAGLNENELGPSFFQEQVCKYILIKILKKSGNYFSLIL